jgi:hypothetical protein
VESTVAKESSATLDVTPHGELIKKLLAYIPVEGQAGIALRDALMKEAANAISALHERLEDSFYFDWEGNRVECAPGSIPDGISCRDETIKMQDEAIDKFRAARSETGELDLSEKARLADALDDVKRLHEEKMKFFERAIELERELAAAKRQACTSKGLPVPPSAWPFQETPSARGCRWIACIDQKPENHATVLTTDGEITSTGFWTGKVWVVDVAAEMDPLMTPTNWMPLPELPHE